MSDQQIKVGNVVTDGRSVLLVTALQPGHLISDGIMTNETFRGIDLAATTHSDRDAGILLLKEWRCVPMYNVLEAISLVDHSEEGELFSLCEESVMPKKPSKKPSKTPQWYDDKWIAVGTEVEMIRGNSPVGTRISGYPYFRFTEECGWILVGTRATVVEVKKGAPEAMCPTGFHDDDCACGGSGILLARDPYALVSLVLTNGQTHQRCIHPSDQGVLWRLPL